MTNKKYLHIFQCQNYSDWEITVKQTIDEIG